MAYHWRRQHRQQKSIRTFVSGPYYTMVKDRALDDCRCHAGTASCWKGIPPDQSSLCCARRPDVARPFAPRTHTLTQTSINRAPAPILAPSQTSAPLVAEHLRALLSPRSSRGWTRHRRYAIGLRKNISTAYAESPKLHLPAFGCSTAQQLDDK